MTPDQYCLSKTRESRSNFYYSFLALPLPKRRAIIALYAFCREVDDIVDNIKSTETANIKLDWWQSEIQALYSEEPTHPVTLALAPHIKNFSLDQNYFQLILKGMKMDLTVHRYKTFSDLKNYCYHVASAVGLLSAKIFGYKDNLTLKFAEELGLALQLTNILRDIGEDAKRGRIYLPQDELKKFNVTENNILKELNSIELSRLLKVQIERAEKHFSAALSALPPGDHTTQKTSLIIAHIYLAILKKLKENQPYDIKTKIYLSSWEKIKIAGFTWLKY